MLGRKNIGRKEGRIGRNEGRTDRKEEKKRMIERKDIGRKKEG